MTKFSPAPSHDSEIRKSAYGALDPFSSLPGAYTIALEGINGVIVDYSLALISPECARLLY